MSHLPQVILNRSRLSTTSYFRMLSQGSETSTIIAFKSILEAQTVSQASLAASGHKMTAKAMTCLRKVIKDASMGVVRKVKKRRECRDKLLPWRMRVQQHGLSWAHRMLMREASLPWPQCLHSSTLKEGKNRSTTPQTSCVMSSNVMLLAK